MQGVLQDEQKQLRRKTKSEEWKEELDQESGEVSEVGQNVQGPGRSSVLKPEYYPAAWAQPQGRKLD